MLRRGYFALPSPFLFSTISMDESKLECSPMTNRYGIIPRSLPCPTGCHGGAGRANLEFYQVLLNVHMYGITRGGERNEY